MTPLDVIQQITASGLRGRGGGGYPTGLKWSTVFKAKGTRKFVICNADEGDPGAFMDRSVLEGDPHRVLEGMAIAAYAVGADQGYVYVRGEYPLAIQRLKTAIKQAEKAQFLGGRILDTGFSFRVDIRIGAGAFVCGEETALIASIEGNRGTPRPRPPYPADERPVGPPDAHQQRRDLRQRRRRSSATAAPGSPRSAPRRARAPRSSPSPARSRDTGLVEVPMGITLREIIFDIGGGIPGGRKFKAVQTGGPSGGCIPAQFLDLPVDYESLAERRLDHGLGRPHRDGRDVLHGRRRQVLHGVLPRRVVRQVHPLPRRHRADVGAARQDHARARRRAATSTSSSTWRTCSRARASAASGRRRPTRWSRARCATSATSTSRTSTSGGARPGSARSLPPPRRCTRERQDLHPERRAGQRRRGPDDPRRLRRAEGAHPPPVPPRGPRRDRRLPALHGRDRGLEEARSLPA